MPQNRNLGGWVIGLWAFNAFCIFVLGIGIVLFWDKTPFSSAKSALPTEAILLELPTLTPSPKIPSPLWIITSTTTPRPTITPYVYITDTPTPPPWMQGPITIGYSVGARPLELYRFGDGPAARMIVAGIHGGNEWNTIVLADELINYLRDHPEIIPYDITLYILRDMNPDGEARGHNEYGRTNDNGVDLNRNFPFDWKDTWNKDGCWSVLPVTAGAYPASEPETVSLMIFIQQHKIGALISYHSAAMSIFPGGVPLEEDSIRLAQALARVSGYNYPPLETGCEYTGNLADWATSMNIAAVDIELTDHEDTDFDKNLKILKTFLKWER